jgi:hypothetical protein
MRGSAQGRLQPIDSYTLAARTLITTAIGATKFMLSLAVSPALVDTLKNLDRIEEACVKRYGYPRLVHTIRLLLERTLRKLLGQPAT